MATSDFSSKQTKHDYFKTEFDRLANNGVIGDPAGVPAYAYIRVSTDKQGEEGRSGLPRQIEHVHMRALETGYRITWDMVFADDFSGFELSRPALDQLRHELKNRPLRRASTLVIEDIDRLSRDSDWHQGYLLYELEEQCKVTILFFSKLEDDLLRKIRGIIAHEEIKKAKVRMSAGIRKKAESKRVTTRRPNYGYKFVDENGNEGERARRQTYYAIREDQAAVMRMVYQRVAAGETLVSIAKDLDARKVPTPKNTKTWIGGNIGMLIKKEVYKGDCIANRSIWVEVEKPTKDGLSTRLVKVISERPPEEWIHIPVPAIVDAELWQAANDMLEKNKARAARNADKNQRYLLTGMLKCPDCGTTFRGKTIHPAPYNRYRKSSQSYSCRYSGSAPRYMIDNHGKCPQRSIAASIIEPAVWEVVCNSLLTPDDLIDALHEDTFNEQNTLLDEQIAYLDKEIADAPAKDEKLYKAYMAGGFDEDEFATKRKLLKAETARLTAERDRLIPQRVSIEQFESQKQLVIDFAERLQSMNAHSEPSFELKQRILKMAVDQIIVNSREGWFRLEGIVRGTYAIENTTLSK